MRRSAPGFLLVIPVAIMGFLVRPENAFVLPAIDVGRKKSPVMVKTHVLNVEMPHTNVNTQLLEIHATTPLTVKDPIQMLHP